MQRRNFLNRLMLIPASLFAGLVFFRSKARVPVKMQFLRHATFFLQVGETIFLCDPMLSAKNAMDPVKNAANALRNPMRELPLKDGELRSKLKSIDAVLLTHTHRDHWDKAAQELIPKSTPIICQPADVELLKKQGFLKIIPCDKEIEFNGIRIFRTGGQHGVGEVGKEMGDVSGFIVRKDRETVYVAGDTIWCSQVEQALKQYKPQTVVVNTGAAQFLEGGPITMDAKDVLEVAHHAPKSQIIAVHMNTINHCLLKKEDLVKILTDKGLLDRCMVPFDGEEILLND